MNKSIRLLTAIIILIFLFTLASSYCFAERVENENVILDSGKIFADVKNGKWYKEYVDYAFSCNLFEGTSENKFEPNTPMNRAMFVTVLARMDGFTPTTNNVFTKFDDIQSNKWYTPYVKWATDASVVTGVTERKFEPLTNVTREQMCTMIVRYAEYKNIRFTKQYTKTKFDDDAKIKSYAKNAVYYCQTSGLINGMTPTTFEPAGTATRAQVSKILSGFHKDYVHDGNQIMTNPEIADYNNVLSDIFWKHDDFLQQVSKSNARALGNSIFSYSLSNPIIEVLGYQPNRYCLPSFDIDATWFSRAGTRLKDFPKKEITIICPERPQFSYVDDNGKTVNECQWFDLLKKELGFNVRYITSDGYGIFRSSVQYMLAGKKLDVIYSDHVSNHAALSIAKNITEYVNIHDYGSAPGVSYDLMMKTADYNGFRAVIPELAGDVLWYNQSLVNEYGLEDPHTLWENGQWTTDKFRSFMYTAPNKLKNGSPLTAFTQDIETAATSWVGTHGGSLNKIEHDKGVLSYTGFFDDYYTKKAWEFVTTTLNSVNATAEYVDGVKIPDSYKGLFEGRTLMSSQMYELGSGAAYSSKTKQINWVPYPTEDGKTYSSYNGLGMMVPIRSVDKNDIGFVLKFMELWAARYTEAVLDTLKLQKCYNFDDKELYEFYNYMTSGNIQYSVVIPEHVGTIKAFNQCFTGDSSVDVQDEIIANAKSVQQYLWDYDIVKRS